MGAGVGARGVAETEWVDVPKAGVGLGATDAAGTEATPAEGFTGSATTASVVCFPVEHP